MQESVRHNESLDKKYQGFFKYTQITNQVPDAHTVPGISARSGPFCPLRCKHHLSKKGHTSAIVFLPSGLYRRSRNFTWSTSRLTQLCSKPGKPCFSSASRPLLFPTKPMFRGASGWPSARSAGDFPKRTVSLADYTAGEEFHLALKQISFRAGSLGTFLNATVTACTYSIL